MDFSSANVPISRETWAPRSPPTSSRTAPLPSATATAPPHSAAPTGSSRYEDYGAPPRSAGHAAPPPAMGPRNALSSAGNGNGYGSGVGSGYSGSGGRGGGYDRSGGDRERSSAYPGGGGGGGGQGAHGGPARARGALQATEPTNVLGVFGLSIRTRERDLEDEFQRYGDVEKVVIVYDQRTDRSRGFGFITMRSIEDASRCVDKLNGAVLQGRGIRVDYSATQKPHAPTPGQYMGEKKPIYEDRYAPQSDRGRYDSRSRYDDRRGYDDRDRDRRDRHDDRDRRERELPRQDRDVEDYRRPRESSDRRRDASPRPRRSRYSASPDRRPPPREYDAPPPAGEVPRY